MPGSAKQCVLFYGVAVAALGTGGGAWAQATSASDRAANAGTSLQEVVVTAQKRSERLVDVPMAISVVSAASAQARGINDIQDLSQAVAGVDITFGGFAVQPAIRGVTSTNPLLENNVGVYIDGFYQQDQNTINARFPNLQDVEILKGPQGTLYGRNATGGAILYNTAPPSRTFTGSLEGSYGNFNTRSLTGYISGPISDRMRFSVAGYGFLSNGYYDLVSPTTGAVINDKGAPIRSFAVRTKLAVDLTDNLTATLGYNYTELKDPRGDVFQPETNIPGGAPHLGRLDTPYTNTFADIDQFDAAHDAQLTLVWKTPIGTLTSHTGQTFRTSKDDFQYGYPVDILEKIHDRNFQESVDFSVTAIKHLDLTVGGTYFRDVLNTSPSDVTVNETLVLEDTHTEFFTSAYALFAQGAYHLFDDRLTLSAGIRYSEEEKSESYAITNDILTPSCPTCAPGEPNLPLNAANNHANFPNFSPQGSIRYKLAEGSEIYASITDGFRSGQVQIFTGPTGANIFAPVKPEKITAYEIGYKLDRRTLQFTTAGFYYDYTNLQQSVTLPNPSNPSAPISFVSNAPKATIYGVEAEVKWKPMRDLNVDVSGDYLHARYGSFPGASGVGLDAATGTNISPQTQDWTGQRLSRAPDFSATFATDYTFEDVFGGKLTPEVNVKVTTKYMIDNASLYGPEGPPGLQNTQRYVQPGYALANASVTWTDPTGHYHITGYVDNLSNTMYRLDFDGASYGNYNTWAWPRTYGVRIGAKF